MSDFRKVSPETGFTLLEVVIALAILAVLSILTTQSIRTGLQQKATISRDLNNEAQVTDALRIMRTDIAAAFHHRDTFVSMMNELNAPPTPAPAAPGAGAPGSVPQVNVPQAAPVAQGTPRPTPPQVTGFVGEADSLYFTTLSNSRVIQDSKESSQAKVGYFLKSCRPRGASHNKKSAQAVQCLYRSLSPQLDEDIATPGAETVLLENVEEFRLLYYGPDREEPVPTWKTGEGGDAVSKENFPYAVEITLKMHDKNDPKSKPVSMTVLAPLRFPNNPPKKDDGTGQPASASGI